MSRRKMRPSSSEYYVTIFRSMNKDMDRVKPLWGDMPPWKSLIKLEGIIKESFKSGLNPDHSKTHD